MQHLIQKAIAQTLLADSAIASFLTNGKSSPYNAAANNVYAEGDVRPSYPPPYIVLRFARQRPGTHRHEFIQTWHIQIYNKDRGYYAVEAQLENLIADFDEQQISIDSSSHLFCLPQGIKYVSSIRGYDPVFKTEFVSFIIDIHLMRRNAS